MVDVNEHLRTVCADAGLEVMEQIYGIVGNREEVPDNALLGITAERVYEDYEAWVGPAVDNVEKSLLGEFDG